VRSAQRDKESAWLRQNLRKLNVDDKPDESGNADKHALLLPQFQLGKGSCPSFVIRGLCVRGVVSSLYLTAHVYFKCALAVCRCRHVDAVILGFVEGRRGFWAGLRVRIKRGESKGLTANCERRD
jgi:hypothetical protein